MNKMVWLRIKADGTTEHIKDGDESPGLSVMQESVGGYIERIPNDCLWQGPVVRYIESFEFTDQQGLEQQIEGGIVEMYCNEEAKMPLWGMKTTEEKSAHIAANINKLTYILENWNRDFLLGDVLVCIVVVESND